MIERIPVVGVERQAGHLDQVSRTQVQQAKSRWGERARHLIDVGAKLADGQLDRNLQE